jgi:hypothetical protein
MRRLELLQSTIAGMYLLCDYFLCFLTNSPGVIILHLLLIPGAAFITGGARIWEQELHPHLTQLNQSLLTIGCVGTTIHFQNELIESVGSCLFSCPLRSLLRSIER